VVAVLLLLPLFDLRLTDPPTLAVDPALLAAAAVPLLLLLLLLPILVVLSSPPLTSLRVGSVTGLRFVTDPLLLLLLLLLRAPTPAAPPPPAPGMMVRRIVAGEPTTPSESTCIDPFCAVGLLGDNLNGTMTVRVVGGGGKVDDACERDHPNGGEVKLCLLKGSL
jgi:hypothetical protein